VGTKHQQLLTEKKKKKVITGEGKSQQEEMPREESSLKFISKRKSAHFADWRLRQLLAPGRGKRGLCRCQPPEGESKRDEFVLNMKGTRSEIYNRGEKCVPAPDIRHGERR